MVSEPGMLTPIAEYYSEKLKRHGTTALGVDWNGEESQELRFEQLVKLIEGRGYFSINDLGCGYGALLSYLKARFHDFSYSGCDISADMIAAANRFHASRAGQARFTVARKPGGLADYCVASGIFNVRAGRSDEVWGDYLIATLGMLHRYSRRGFAFNCLTAYSDAEKMRPDLFYADPCWLFDHCKRAYSRDVALLHDYGLYEFTILVRKAHE